MKNVIKPDNYNDSPSSKSLVSGLSERLIPTAILGLTILAVPLTGCVIDEPVQTVNQTTAVITENTVQIEEQIEVSSGDEERPYGVTIEADPDVLIECDLERVVDGDTIIVHDPDGNRLRVRLTGINAPESVHEDESKNTEEGRQASKFMKELLEDVDVVYLEYDEAQFDQYERTLAYVWIDIDGTYVMVNEIMLATDYAEPVYIKPNLRYADVFRQYEG
ncbi:MAG: thermonuclease family protein [Clostridiales bacterium]|nr:thermonuclease family protein [Clostridiales bacterium]MBQ1574339.1 thermonuclease family protein [Clostridiales bacterium]